MSKPIIEISNISKKYRLTHQREQYVALRDVLTNVVKKFFSFAKPSKGVAKNTKEDFWALKDISFNVEPGEAIGIIGPNGAGKTTLLKILSQITPPTRGEIKISGRVASLLEVGTGFHPELTGRENIFLNGAILGMTRAEIVKKFDEIVNFAGLEKFLDTPVKRYSSGMFVRLAFAVAAHLEPEILLIDEVLAVGDAEFQKKCLRKMDDITKKSGRTILFISHNMAAVQSLCDRCVYINKGQVQMIGETKEVIQKYLSTSSIGCSKKLLDNYNQEDQKIKALAIELKNGIGDKFCASWSQPIKLLLEIEVKERVEQVCFVVGFTTVENVLIFSIRHTDQGDKLWDLDKGKYKILIKIDNLLRAGIYGINIRAHSITKKSSIFNLVNVVQLEISDVSLDDRQYAYQANGIMNIGSEWQIIK